MDKTVNKKESPWGCRPMSNCKKLVPVYGSIKKTVSGNQTIYTKENMTYTLQGGNRHPWRVERKRFLKDGRN